MKKVSLPKKGQLLFDTQAITPEHLFNGVILEQGEELRIADIIAGQLIFRPIQDFHGTDSFIWRASKDGIWSDDEQVLMTIKHVNDPPVFNTIHHKGFEDTPLYLSQVNIEDAFYDSDGDNMESIRLTRISGDFSPQVIFNESSLALPQN